MVVPAVRPPRCGGPHERRQGRLHGAGRVASPRGFPGNGRCLHWPLRFGRTGDRSGKR
ncbi:hypothetical protein STXM2123_3907 [Streptomyces sp. F-3]|nr:hypothetical protein STXM2123_3907 [Streptomyces sp. F-3]